MPLSSRESASPYATTPQRLARVLMPVGMPRSPSAAPSGRANPSARRSSRTNTTLIAVLAFVAATSFGRVSLARRGGIAAEGCDGCHSGGEATAASVEANISQIDLNQSVTLTLSVPATNGPAAGFYLHCSVGTFQVIDSGTRAVAPDGVTHSAPRVGTGSETTFTVGWTAPAQVGGVDFFLYAVSASNDGTNSGDATGSTVASYAIGCAEGTTYYRDFDGDGYGGVNSGSTVSCVIPPLYAPLNGDCDDNTATVHPGSPEICDRQDNDCNGQIDENLPISTYCQDDDGDGYGVQRQATIQSCGPTSGFGLCDNDCDDEDTSIYPGAEELCNSIDDNCDERIDENVRPTCGTGWCRSSASGCDSTSVCFPGDPRKEECNLFDDDCDGVDDNGTDLELCGRPGFTCQLGQCVAAGDVGADGGSARGSGASEGVAPIGTGAEPGGLDPGASSPAEGEASGCAVSHAMRTENAAWCVVAGSLFLAVKAGRRARWRRPALRPRRGA
jgi:hypothetical protein